MKIKIRYHDSFHKLIQTGWLQEEGHGVDKDANDRVGPHRLSLPTSSSFCSRLIIISHVIGLVISGILYCCSNIRRPFWWFEKEDSDISVNELIFYEIRVLGRKKRRNEKVGGNQQDQHFPLFNFFSHSHNK